MAEYQLRQIAEQAAMEFGLRSVTVHHRVGFIAVGEPSLFMRVASPHREEAFRASRWIVNELKKKVPIWKRPRFKMRNDMRPWSTPSATAAIPATTK
jgi:molybdopterin synthase catalytic subunit